MNNAQITRNLAIKMGLTTAEARKVLHSVISAIVEEAVKGDSVAVNGFGKFKVKTTPARVGRNPATGEAIALQASRTLMFTPSPAFRSRLQD